MEKYIVTFLLIMSLVACAPAKFISQQDLNIKFNPTQPYILDLSTMPKPDVIKPIFVDKDFKEVDKSNASYIVLAPKEYAKVAGLLKLTNAYKDITREQEILINTYIRSINSLKEFVELDQLKINEYRTLWVDSENMFRQEKHDHRVDNVINRGAFGVISIGAIIAIILAL